VVIPNLGKSWDFFVDIRLAQQKNLLVLQQFFDLHDTCLATCLKDILTDICYWPAPEGAASSHREFGEMA
jgi:hypothetical protein